MIILRKDKYSLYFIISILISIAIGTLLYGEEVKVTPIIAIVNVVLFTVGIERITFQGRYRYPSEQPIL